MGATPSSGRRVSTVLTPVFARGVAAKAAGLVCGCAYVLLNVLTSTPHAAQAQPVPPSQSQPATASPAPPSSSASRSASPHPSSPAKAPATSRAAKPGKAAAAAPASAQNGGKWLDRTLTNWNTKLTTIPHAVMAKDAAPMDPRCNETHRSGHSAEDKLITGAGWTLFGEEQQFDDVALVMALTSVDGMCRPLGYQGFVFVEGKLAGTVSPEPMNARMDGSTGPIHLTSTSRLTVGFNRYTPADAMCCPSKRQIVTYNIERSGPRPLLVPRDVVPLGR